MTLYKLPYNMPKKLLNELIQKGMESERTCEGCKWEGTDVLDYSPCDRCARLLPDNYEVVKKMSELKPCPFCGVYGDEQHKDRCYLNMISIMQYEWDAFTDEEVCEAWNTRAERTCNMEKVSYPCKLNGDVMRFYCSECGYMNVLPKPYLGLNYCCNCGAKVVSE